MEEEKKSLSPPAGSYAYSLPHPSAYSRLQQAAIKDCSLLLASSSVSRRELLTDACIPFGCFSVPVDEDDVQKWLEREHTNLPADISTMMIAQMKADSAVHALKGPHTERLQQFRFLNQIKNIPAAERVKAIQEADKAARTTGAAAAAVAQLAVYTDAAAVQEAAEGRRPIIIAADTGIEMGGCVLFKPKSKKQAEDFIRSYSNATEPVAVVTSVVLVDLLQEIDNPPADPNKPAASSSCGGECCACGAETNKSKEETFESESDEKKNICCCPATVTHAAAILNNEGGPALYRNDSRRVAFGV